MKVKLTTLIVFAVVILAVAWHLTSAYAGVCGPQTGRDPATAPAVPGDPSTCPVVTTTTEAPPILAPPVVIVPTLPPPVRLDVRIEEDDPRWDCRTMGNRICGPAPTLPATL